jgi:hypothetical protein
MRAAATVHTSRKPTGGVVNRLNLGTSLHPNGSRSPAATEQERDGPEDDVAPCKSTGA